MRLPEAFSGHPAYLAVWIVTYWLCFGPEIVISVLLRSARTAQKFDKGSKLMVILAANLAVLIGFSVAAAFPSLSIDAGWKILFDPEIVAIETNAAGGRMNKVDRATETLAGR